AAGSAYAGLVAYNDLVYPDSCGNPVVPIAVPAFFIMTISAAAGVRQISPAHYEVAENREADTFSGVRTAPT
ncbi:MAG: hypothetical protein ABIF82_12010, partial [Planctomycetota bacterium]